MCVFLKSLDNLKPPLNGKLYTVNGKQNVNA